MWFCGLEYKHVCLWNEKVHLDHKNNVKIIIKYFKLRLLHIKQAENLVLQTIFLNY